MAYLVTCGNSCDRGTVHYRWAMVAWLAEGQWWRGREAMAAITGQWGRLRGGGRLQGGASDQVFQLAAIKWPLVGPHGL